VVQVCGKLLIVPRDQEKKCYPYLGTVLLYQRKPSTLEEEKRHYGPQGSNRATGSGVGVRVGREVDMNPLASRQGLEKSLRLGKSTTFWGKVKKFLLLKITTDTM